MRSEMRGKRLLRTTAALAVVAVMGAACSDDALGDLGGRSGGWIDEVVTTASSTTTTLPDPTRSAMEVNWVNDHLAPAPDPELGGDGVLGQVFARTGGESRFLQASRAEIAATAPEVEFPTRVPSGVSYITSQLVIESRTLRLADDPTVAFGLWSVEPYTQSRSIGQLAVLNVSTDATDSEVANDPNTAPTCTAFAQVADRVCGIETFGENPVWRLESESEVTHLWYRGIYRYEMVARGGVDEELIHTAVLSMAPLIQQLADSPE